MSDNASDQVLGIVRWVSRTREVDAEIVFQAIESAIKSAAGKQYGNRSDVLVSVDRTSGEVFVSVDGDPIPPDDAFETEAMIQAATKRAAEILAHAEQAAMLEKYHRLAGGIVFAEVPRTGGRLMLNSGRVSCRMPKDERMPGDNFKPGASVACVVMDAARDGDRVRVSLSRSRSNLVSGLLAHFVPEVADGRIAIHALSRDAGYRSKAALISRTGESCVDACLGESGERIGAVCDQLGGEKVDLIDWQASMEANISAALSPATVDGVYLFPMPGKAIAVLDSGEVSMAQGRNGRNLRLASKLCGWDIELATPEQWHANSVAARQVFAEIGDSCAINLLAAGIFTPTELSMVEPDDIMRICRVDADSAAKIIAWADERAEA